MVTKNETGADKQLNRNQLAALDLIKHGRHPRHVAGVTLAALVRRDMIWMDMGRWELTDAGRAFCFPSSSDAGAK